ncbi:uncharacterized protein N7511_001401 [Penicillium nucicola]|uniref:uncharacterized protein n=1 Tax=Penicillium nucicola TaxID=1850975 RepID=UPI00254581E2|nr:uncharacterized protein N7511_001401 [Penicillium nucicola]KAJ5776390.1 hypothetical protein N7511_001401 [Penicillium nucicola]
MQKLRSSQALSPQIIRLAIAKFSHTTTTIDHIGPLTWNHVSGNGDLVCVFEKLPSSASASIGLIQRVIRGNVILEDINVTDLVRMAQLRAQSDTQGSLPKFPFAAVVKLPCLAIKYPEGGTHIRRFQIKFTMEGDYHTALAILGEIGCPLTEGNTPALRPTPSVSSWTSGHLSHAPSIMIPSTSVRSIGAPFNHIGAYGSQRTSASLRASSPASTVSYAPCRFGPRQPTFNHPAQSLEPLSTVPFQSTQAPYVSYQEPEASSSQSFTVPAIHNLEQLNQMLPPKRDLPFQKPPSKKARSASVARPAESAKDQDRIHHPFDAVMQPELSVLDPGLQEAGTLIPSQQSQCAAASQKSLACENLITSPEVSSTDRVVEHLAQRATLQNASQLQSQPGANNRVGIVTGPERIQDQSPSLPSFGSASVPHAVPAMTEDHLAQYLAAPTPERVAFLENWMCDLIEDDRFMSLCQDVEGTWRRFAFGKRQ